MAYICFAFEIDDDNLRDMFVAHLSNIGFDGFEEQEKKLVAYIDSSSLNEELVKDFIEQYGVAYTQEEIENVNWNEKWEQDFQPVIVDDFCTIRAHFHNIPVSTRYEIVITPKMSFGTGHHATTQLMVKQMADIDFRGQKVFDFGTGTGILAILAEKLNAGKVVAIDNDEWSVENTAENIVRNQCERISVRLASLENVQETAFDIILANINRNILLQYMEQLHEILKNEGLLLMSGLLLEDRPIIEDAASKAGLSFLKTEELNNWITLLFKK